MIRLVRFIAIALGFIFLFASPSFSGDNVFKTVHMLNLKSELKEIALKTLIEDLNQCLAKHGIENVHYQVWKLRDDSDCKYRYIFESTWPDITTYNRIHATKEYKKLRIKWQQNWASVLDEQYGRYEPMN